MLEDDNEEDAEGEEEEEDDEEEEEEEEEDDEEEDDEEEEDAEQADERDDCLFAAELAPLSFRFRARISCANCLNPSLPLFTPKAMPPPSSLAAALRANMLATLPPFF